MSNVSDGQKNVTIEAIEMTGNDDIKLTFDDGHGSDLFSWGLLYDMCIHKDQYWNDYLSRIHKAGSSRDPDASVVRLV